MDFSLLFATGGRNLAPSFKFSFYQERSARVLASVREAVEGAGAPGSLHSMWASPWESFQGQLCMSTGEEKSRCAARILILQ